MALTKRYCVYAHLNPETDEIFYIGKGTHKRAYNLLNRSSSWKKEVSEFQDKVEVRILKENLTSNEALDLENELIEKLGKRIDNEGNLVNWLGGSSEGIYIKLHLSDFEDIFIKSLSKFSENERQLIIKGWEKQEKELLKQLDIITELDPDKKKEFAKKIQKELDKYQDKFWKYSYDPIDVSSELSDQIDSAITQIIYNLDELSRNEIYTKDLFEDLFFERNELEDYLHEFEGLDELIDSLAKELINIFKNFETLLKAS